MAYFLRRGLELVAPSGSPSVATTGAGSSATVSANGSVSFTACATLSLNNVFSADYDNYMIVAWHSTSGDYAWRFRLRASGTDNSTASSYMFNYIFADSTTVSGSRTTTDYGQVSARGNTHRTGFVAQFFGPYLTIPTSYTSMAADDYLNASVFDINGTHNQSVAYDGITFIAAAASFSGRVAVYGVRK